MSGRGQFRKDPFHINRDDVDDNHSVTRRLRLPRGAQIRVQRQFGSAVFGGGINTVTVPMPYTGNYYLTATNPVDGTILLINNPFIRTTAGATLAQNIASNFIAVGSQPAGSTFVISAVNPGQVTVTMGGNVNGLYVISVGRRTDRRNTGYAQ